MKAKETLRTDPMELAMMFFIVWLAAGCLLSSAGIYRAYVTQYAWAFPGALGTKRVDGDPEASLRRERSDMTQTEQARRERERWKEFSKKKRAAKP